MNQDQLTNLVQKLVVLASGYAIAHGVGDNALWQIIGGAVAAIVTWYISHKWNATPGPVQTKLPLMLFLVLLVPAFYVACAHLQPGADPIVVRVEQTETVAKSTFDLVLNVDNSKRDFFRTNAPGFHNFCEWLRAPQTVEGTNILPRCSAMLVSLDDVKLDYKAARVSSNAVFTALQTVTGAMAQANSWLSVTTNQPTQ